MKNWLTLYFCNTMKLTLPILYFLTFSASVANAQLDQSQIQSTPKGIVKVQQSKEIETAIEQFKKFNYSSSGVEGFRIQIFSESGNDAKAKADKVVAEYKKDFTSPMPYLTYQQPNFKVRCGDFRTRAEARKYVKSISAYFPSAFIVKDFIEVEQ